MAENPSLHNDRALLADLLTSRVNEWPDDEARCRRVLALATEEGVQGLLAVSPAARSDAITAELKLAHRQLALRELAARLALREVLGVLDADGIQVLVLKGNALAYWLYPSPELRPCSDIDILVRDRVTAERAVDLLLAAGYRLAAGVRPGRSAESEVALFRGAADSFAIDLHWTLVNHARLTQGFKFDDLITASQPLPALHPAGRGLSAVHALTHASLHRITNIPTRKQDRLIWLYDVHLLATSFGAEAWELLTQECRRLGTAKPVRDALNASANCVESSLPPEVFSSLGQAGVGETWEYTETTCQAEMDRSHVRAMTMTARVQWLRNKLFPSPEFMRERYGLQDRQPMWLAYFSRWKIALGRTRK